LTINGTLSGTNIPIHEHKIVCITSTTNWVVPNNVQYIKVLAVCGGGGGGCSGQVGYYFFVACTGKGGLGGDAGQLILAHSMSCPVPYLRVTPGTTVSFVVGAGGAGGVCTSTSSYAYKTGGAGGASYISYNGRIYFYASGGAGGYLGE